MYEMFEWAINFNQDIGRWNVGAVESIDSMFFNASAFNQNIGQWDVSNFTNFNYMFYGAIAFNQDIGGWDVSSGNGFTSMFQYATSFNQDLGSWNMQTAEYANHMFTGTNLSTQNYDAILIGWASQSLKSNVLFSAGSTYFCNGESARNDLVTLFNWTIFDYGKKCTIFVEMDGNTEDSESSGGNLPVLLVFGTSEVPTTVLITDSNSGDAMRNIDYRFTSPQTVTIPPGTYDGTRATGIAIPTLEILDDNIVEEDETIQLSVSQPTTNAELKDANGDGVIFTLHTYTILNDDICTDDSQCPGSTICNLKQNPALCAAPDTCGNGTLEAGEFCDDGNVELADGCNADCKIENGSACVGDDACASNICDDTNANSVCEPADTCGNGVVETDEICDDGNIATGDGCDENCKLEDNVVCDKDAFCASGVCDKSATPGRCEPNNTCGNNIIEDGEACDDGGTIIGDGCDSLCAIEEDAIDCVGDRNCPEGLVCMDGVCDVECRSNADCENADCNLGQCIACTQNEDCEIGNQCQAGHCVASCTTDEECAPQGFCDEKCVECLETEHCLENEICTEGICDDPDRCDPNLENCEGICESNTDCKDARIPYCDTQSKRCGECNLSDDCSNNEVCVTTGSVNICEPGCNADTCGESVCGQDGLCVECQEDADCVQGQCSVETKKCEPDGNEDLNSKDNDVVNGCGCASNGSKIPFAPFMFCLFIGLLRTRRTKVS